MLHSSMRSLRRLRSTRTAPSGYESLRVVFHGLRTAQLLSSLVVGAIMSFFMYHLAKGELERPWTFIVLAAVSLLTVACLIVTILLHCFTGLSPHFNISLNSVLALIWAMGFGMLSYYMWGTLTHYCDTSNWHDGTGVMVCRIYKAVFTFSLLGLVSTLAALALDVHILRLTHRSGKHMRLEDVDHKRHVSASRGLYTDEDQIENPRYTSSPNHSRRSSPREGGLGSPYQRFGLESSPRQSNEVPGEESIARGSERRVLRQGYAVPEGQFDYDTGYHGNAGEVSGLGLYGGK